MTVIAPPGYAAIITAAGRGTRAGGDLPKQWQMLGNRPVLAHTLAAFAGFERVILTVHPDDMPRAIEHFGGRCVIVVGGETRAASIANALETLDDSTTHVLIHDGARPLTPDTVIRGVIDALSAGAPAAAPALPVSDALWRGENDIVTAAIPRDGLFRAQTPQGFLFAQIRHHYADAGTAADDVELALRAGIPVTITPGSEDNLKITWPADFARAERILGAPMDIRLGNGFDVHATGPGDHVWLCGVQVPHDHGLIGHSDADVGMHALTDAIYGALAEGDIGRHFPPSDPQWKGADSAIFLRHAADLARTRGFRIGNADVTLICEQPKITPHAPAMMARLAEIMGADPTRISVKATTSERLGFTGRGEGIAAIATCALIGA
ncbi:MAG: bifunctional 2-C-methyl-D-erythritol 4-phosphate cytidylyltransferase/2-C-methyl-D-erythritol 2,4-cyclodiphosphate synthase [Paracoccus sp. (in: a-proteobacteria)]|nr:bifunctional 2-C-methyl-D-erythritol 4-phosphate cytidylyltransferase/2-C-methyl-D-erythritol 2,4-cyclodiphosphate synthase [Paracoccus sp. (in: a-proteobacteria)]